MNIWPTQCVCVCVCVCVHIHIYMLHAQLLSHVGLFATPQILVHKAPLPMKFFRQDYWSGLPFPAPGDLPDPQIKPASLLHLQADLFNH